MWKDGRGAQTWTQHPRCGRTSAGERGRITSLDIPQMLSDAAHRAANVCCKAIDVNPFGKKRCTLTTNLSVAKKVGDCSWNKYVLQLRHNVQL